MSMISAGSQGERGTGGDGTIRRKRQRRLRWSSPPGQGEQVPLGFSPPPGTAVVRLAGDQPGKPSAGFMFEKVCKCRGRLNAGDARGGAPCIQITDKGLRTLVLRPLSYFTSIRISGIMEVQISGIIEV